MSHEQRLECSSGCRSSYLSQLYVPENRGPKTEMSRFEAVVRTQMQEVAAQKSFISQRQWHSNPTRTKTKWKQWQEEMVWTIKGQEKDGTLYRLWGWRETGAKHQGHEEQESPTEDNKTDLQSKIGRKEEKRHRKMRLKTKRRQN